MKIRKYEKTTDFSVVILSRETEIEVLLPVWNKEERRDELYAVKISHTWRNYAGVLCTFVSGKGVVQDDTITGEAYFTLYGVEYVAEVTEDPDEGEEDVCWYHIRQI